MNWEIYLKRKPCANAEQSARKKVAVVVGVNDVQRAI